LRYCHDVSTTISQHHEQLAQTKACPHFIKGKVRRKMRKRVLEMQRVQTLSPTLQKREKGKRKIGSPK